MTELPDKAKFHGFLKNPKIRRRLRKLTIAVAILAAVICGAGIFIGFYYEDTMKKLIIAELNKHLTSRIEVKDIEFSVFKKFPYASVHFIEVTAYNPEPDTAKLNLKNIRKIKHQRMLYDKDSILLQAQDVYLQFSVLDLIFGNYRIKKLDVVDGHLNIKNYRDGGDNYHFWKPSQDTVSEKKFTFDLQKLKMKNLAVVYRDYKHNNDFRIHARNLNLHGKFSEREYALDIQGSMKVHCIKVDNTDYFSSKNTMVDIVLKVNNDTETYTFEKGEVSVGNMLLKVTGYVTYNDTQKELDLNIEGKDLPLQSFINELPESYQNRLSDYKAAGNFTFTARVKGSLEENHTPDFRAEFSLKNGKVTQKKSDITLESVVFDAVYEKLGGKKDNADKLTVSEFSAKLRESTLRGNIAVVNFNSPEIELEAKADFNLRDLHDFLRFDTLVNMSGDVELEMSYRGKLSNTKDFTVADFINSKSSGTLSIRNGNLQFKGNQFNLSSLQGNFRFSNNDIISDNFSGKIGSSDFNIKGYFRNIMSFLFLKDKRLQIAADFTSHQLNMQDLMVMNISGSDTVYQFSISDRLDLNFNIRINNFTFGKFQAGGISGQLKIRNSQLLAKDITLYALDGRASLTGFVDASKSDKILISCDASISKVNLHKLFLSFNNFGQPNLTADNLRGNVTASVQFASVWSSDFKPDLATVYTHALLTVENGELISYKPVQILSRHFKDRDFSHVRFSTLTMQIDIKDKVIHIPKTEINSDAVNFSIYGTHTFDNQIDYHISLLFSEFKRPTPVTENEFGVIEDDGTGKARYFCRITGTAEKPVFEAIDKQAYKQHITQNLKKEKENLKDILNKEFGWFKKDTTGKKDKKPESTKGHDKKDKSAEKNKSREFIIEWEEE